MMRSSVNMIILSWFFAHLWKTLKKKNKRKKKRTTLDNRYLYIKYLEKLIRNKTNIGGVKHITLNYVKIFIGFIKQASLRIEKLINRLQISRLYSPFVYE